MAPGDLITSDGQIEWRGLLLGAGTAYGWRELDGWRDLPGVDSGNVPKPAQHGAWPGRAYAQERTLTLTALVRSLVAAFPATVQVLSSATVLSEDGVEEALAVSTLGERRLVYGQITARAMPVDKAYAVGHGNATIQWTCADPRLYSLTEHVLPIAGPSAGSGGLAYPLTYPLTYGTPAGPGTGTVANAGDTPTHPQFTLTGPLTDPRILNLTTGAELGFDLTLDSTETLTIDTGDGTVLLNNVADRAYTLTAASVPLEAFTLTDAANDLALLADVAGPGSQLSVAWRDAWM